MRAYWLVEGWKLGGRKRIGVGEWLKYSRRNDPAICSVSVYNDARQYIVKKSVYDWGFRLINFLITNSSKWVPSPATAADGVYRPTGNFWCDWWAARRVARTSPADTIMIIINFTGIIGYRLYLFSTAGCLSLSYLPLRRRIQAKSRTDWTRYHWAERNARIYKLAKQRYTTLKWLAK